MKVTKPVVLAVFLSLIGIFGAAMGQRAVRTVKAYQPHCSQVLAWAAPVRDGWSDIWVTSATDQPLACGSVDLLGDVTEVALDPDGWFDANLPSGVRLTEDGAERIIACTVTGIHGWVRLASVQTEGPVLINENPQFKSTVFGTLPNQLGIVACQED